MNSCSWSQVEHFAKELPTGLIAILLKRSFLILLMMDWLTVGRPNEAFVTLYSIFWEVGGLSK